MSSATVRDAFNAALVAEFPTVPVMPTLGIRVDNTTLEDLWMATDFIPANDVPISIGSPACRRESGVFRAYVVGKAGAGEAAVIAQADAVAAYFRTWTDSSGTIRVSGHAPPAPQEQSDGRWLIVAVDFNFNHTYYA